METRGGEWLLAVFWLFNGVINQSQTGVANINITLE